MQPLELGLVGEEWVELVYVGLLASGRPPGLYFQLGVVRLRGLDLEAGPLLAQVRQLLLKHLQLVAPGGLPVLPAASRLLEDLGGKVCPLGHLLLQLQVQLQLCILGSFCLVVNVDVGVDLTVDVNVNVNASMP